MTCKHLIFAATVGLTLLVASQSYAPPTTPVNLGTAGNFTILSEFGISTTGVTSIVGDIGVSPIFSTAITGFNLILDSTGDFSKDIQVTGKVYADDYTPPTQAYLGTAIGNMETAYTDAAGRAPDLGHVNLNSGLIGGLTLGPGVYQWGSSVTISDDLTLTGTANDIWIFQIAGTLDLDPGKKIILNGAQANNIFWQVADTTTLYGTSEFKGTILDKTLIAMQNGATLEGRMLAQTAVTLIGNTVIIPTIQTVPEPCTVLLLGSGLAGLFAWRKRSRSA